LDEAGDPYQDVQEAVLNAPSEPEKTVVIEIAGRKKVKFKSYF